MRDRWDRFSDAELLAVSSALHTTMSCYPDRSDHAVMAALAGETTPRSIQRALQNFTDDHLRSELERRANRTIQRT